MFPEFITPQDGEEKQDCELNAAKRWIEKNKLWLEENKVTLLGDDLFSRAPFIQQISLLQGVRFILTAKPSSHIHLDKWIQDLDPCDYETFKTTETKGGKSHIFNYKMIKNVPLKGTAESPMVNVFEMSVSHKNGKVLYKNSFVTNHEISSSTIHTIARMGRNRWKIENEAFNILKTKGYHLEHNFGHGKKNLSNVLLCFNLIAFLVHQLCELSCEIYKKVRNFFGARVRFFETLSTIMSVQIFDSWDEFLLFVHDMVTPGPN